MKKLLTLDEFILENQLSPKEIDITKFPNPLPSGMKGWLKKGLRDGDKSDDIIKTRKASIAVSKLYPTQSAIYLGKALGLAIKGVEGGDLDAVISKDNYILDGHHRYAATMFNNPKAKVGGVQANLDIGDLIPVLRSAGDAMNNNRGLEPVGGDINIFKATIEDVKACIFDGFHMDSKYYDKEDAIEWFNSVGETTIVQRLNALQSKLPPDDAPPRSEMPKIKGKQVKLVSKLLNKGKIDVMAPYSTNENKKEDMGLFEDTYKKNTDALNESTILTEGTMDKIGEMVETELSSILESAGPDEVKIAINSVRTYLDNIEKDLD